MSTQPKFYLGRNQKIFGPLSEEDIRGLRQSGQLSSYTWMFREGENRWTPIDPPPSLPGVYSQIEQPVPETEVAPMPAPKPARKVDREAYRIILFDHQNAISGYLLAASDRGCEIRAEQNGSDPLFVRNETACLTLHDTRTGDSIKLKVKISEISRSDGGWSLSLRWNSAPSLLEASIAV